MKKQDLEETFRLIKNLSIPFDKEFNSLIKDLGTSGKLIKRGNESAKKLVDLIKIKREDYLEINKRAKNNLKGLELSDKVPFDIPENWQWTKLGFIADFSLGKTPSKDNPVFWQNGKYPWVTIKDLNDNMFVENTNNYVSEQAGEKVFKCPPCPPETILMSFKLTIGKISKLKIPAYHNEAIVSIKPYLDEIEPYLFLALPKFAKEGSFKNAIKGKTLNKESLKNIWIPLPPLDEQLKIVEKTEKINSLLEKIESKRKENLLIGNEILQSFMEKLREVDV